MNCNEFETLVNDLARKALMDASVRDEIYAHAKDCARCNARLAEEKQLTVGLRALAILDENQNAPANVEANLLSAFRKNAASAPAQVPSPLHSSFASSPRSRVNRWWVAAAVILILFALAALRIQKANQDGKVPDHTAVQQEPKPQEQLPHNNENNRTVSPDKPVAPPNSVPQVTGKGGKEKKTTPRKPSGKDLQKLAPQVAANESTRATTTTQEQITQAEITTPYISLTQGYTLPMPDGGQVLRVELPRSALASFGLPVSEERLNERVKADVVVGNDGIARAIRFVR